jgi:GR25 family glycosyltransferase involved in LPS biosynthesis
MAGRKTRKVQKEFQFAQLPTYVINLKERPDRWKRFTDQPAIHEFRRLRRFPAVNGKKLDYKKDRRISVHTKLNILRNYRRSHFEIATLGAIGSSLSHIGVWRRFIASGAPMCLVLEDDAILTADQLKQIQEMIPTLPPNWGMWLLGFYRPNLFFEHLPAPYKPWNRVYNFTAAHAYILRRETALKLLEEPLPIETHIEYYITGASILKEFFIVQHPDVHIEFFRKERGGPRTPDSNTSQHKKSGCPTCDEPDDYSQIFKENWRRTDDGMRVDGIVHGQQSDTILTLRRGATRKNSRHP